MKMKYIINIAVAITFLLLIGNKLSAQDSRVLYFMKNNPYSTFANPAQNINCKLYVGIPFSSNINLSIFNSAIHYNKLIKVTASGKTVTVDNFIETLKRRNWLNLSFNIELLGFGYRVDDLFINVSHKIRLEGYFLYPDVLFKLPIKGNMAYLEKPAEFKHLSLNGTLYHELSLGFQYSINENLLIGVRPKLLMGLANVNTKKSYLKFTTDPETYDIAIQEKLLVNTSLIFNPENPNALDITSNLFKNNGFAIDLGASYDFNEYFGTSFSIVDLGFISWKTNTQNMASKVENRGIYYQDGGFLFSGINVENALNLMSNEDDFGGTLSNMQDTLLAYFPLYQTNKPYMTATYAKLLLSGYYNINKNNSLSLLFRGDIVSKTMLPSFTFAYSGSFFNFLDVYATYSIIGKTYANVGIGLGLRAGPIHMYLLTDNIIAAFAPLNSATMNVQMGMLVHITKNKNKKDSSDNKKKSKVDKKKTNKDNNELILETSNQ